YHAALVHDDDAIGGLHDEVEIVLDDEERDVPVAANGEDVLEQLDAERRADTGDRLVEQHERRLEHEDAREVEQLALSAGERARIGARVRLETDEREQLPCELERAPLVCARSARAEEHTGQPLAGMA